MKTLRKYLLVFLIAFSLSAMADDPAPPDQSGGPSGSTMGDGGGAPIGGGTFILMGLGAAYGYWKVRKKVKPTY
ncbi:MAG: hypothetical protein K9I94_13295 [Bacteroidales bacterium]|nr:hypothetical protein [Bacteroidales bacterium]